MITREHHVDPHSGALIFPPRPGEQADEQIRALAAVMLVIAESHNSGASVPEEALSVLRALGR